MLTPQQIQDKKFEKALFNGYDMGQIDEFLDEILNDYTSLYKENATLKTKMKVLVDRIEEYRAVDEEMRKTLLMAQRTAREITENAHAEAEALLRNARSAAENSMVDLHSQIEQEHQLLEEAKRVNAEYVERIRKMMLSNAEALVSIIDRPPKEKKPVNQPMRKPADFGNDFVVNLPEDVMADSRAMPLPMGEKEARFFEVDLSGAKPPSPEAASLGKSRGGEAYGQKPRYEEKGVHFGKSFDLNDE